eukprot:TRINITY_DN46892_c0_g1_i1.p1 TRINITY_DN46892_c0_g1~~TRINITY_DN46892_c0_g1_i1.p1  ORF type:complete len:552 (+),score=250.07 TRINITY_DN46892_c0_g1_i1:48-1658(+)
MAAAGGMDEAAIAARVAQLLSQSLRISSKELPSELVAVAAAHMPGLLPPTPPDSDASSDAGSDWGEWGEEEDKPFGSLAALRRTCDRAAEAEREADVLEALAECVSRVGAVEEACMDTAAAARAAVDAETALSALAQAAPDAECTQQLRDRLTAAAAAPINRLLAEHAADGWADFDPRWLGSSVPADVSALVSRRYYDSLSCRLLDSLRRTLLRPESRWAAELSSADVRYPPSAAQLCQSLTLHAGFPRCVLSRAAADAACLAHAAAAVLDGGGADADVVAGTVTSPFALAVLAGRAPPAGLPPRVVALQHCDGMFLAAHAELLAGTLRVSPSLSADLASAGRDLQALAASSLEDLTDSLRQELLAQLQDDGPREPIYRLPRALGSLRGAAEGWKEVLPPQTLQVALADVCESLCSWAVRAVLKLRHVSSGDVDDVVEMVSHCQLFETLLADDDADADVAEAIVLRCVPHYGRLLQLLQFPRAEVSAVTPTAFPAFAPGELRSLLCLFHADSTQRQDALDDLERLCLSRDLPLWAE